MSKKTTTSRRKEQFDLNEALLVGVIVKLWGRDDVLARLRVSTRGLASEPDDANSCYVTLRIPGGKIRGKDISLQPGDIVEATGYLTHTVFDESILKFLDAAGRRTFLEDNTPQEDLAAWQNIMFRRSNIMFNVQDLKLLDEKTEPEIVNHIVFEGILASATSIEGDRYLRLAVYDRQTSSSEEKNRRGLPIRFAHYISVKLPEGKAGGREVNAEPKTRMRVSGEIRDHGWSRSLHEALLRTGDERVIAMMQRLPNADELHEIKAQLEAGYVEASAVIVYSPAPRRGEV